MSAYSAAIQASPNNYFFGDAGGGGTGSSLQSPATITPDSAGNTSLLMAASGTGASQLSVLGTNTTSGRIGLSGYGQGYFVGVLDNFSSLQIKNADVVNPDVEILPNGQIILGRGTSTPITTLNSLSVGSSLVSATNSVVVGPLSDTSATIYQSVASNGQLTVGSSAAAPTTLTLFDAGANTGLVRINGTSGGSSVQIYGGAKPTVGTNLPNTGLLQLRSSSAGYAGDGDQNGIVLQDNPVSNARPTATFASQIVLPSSDAGSWSGIAGQLTTGITALTGAGQASGTMLNATAVSLPLPPSGAAYTGLWMCRILTRNAADTQATQAVQSFTTYWDGAVNAFAYGGSANPYFVAVSSVITNAGNARTVAIESGGLITGYQFAQYTASTITGMACQWVQLTGAF